MKDEGHQKLINDLKNILGRAESGMYHDFHENGVALPKVTLVSDLEFVIANTKSGEYDN